MKLAIVQDDIVRKGGAEQVALSFHNAFPSAPIYTLSFDAKNSYPEFIHCNIKTSWYGKLIKGEKNMKRFFFPLGVLAMQHINLTGYDIVLQSTTHCAKYIKIDKNAVVITYCHTPFRLAWNPNSYESVSNSKSLKRVLFRFVVAQLKKIDQQSALRTDYFIANSSEVVPRIIEAYNPKHPIAIINPSVNCKNFYVGDRVRDYYLVVSRFEWYKRVDIVIEAFNKMPEKKLIIVGKGTLEKELKASANDNIAFMTGLNAYALANLYAHCKAFIFPQLEDFGITPLEANASGRPVIAYGKGGVLDTMIPLAGESEKSTAIFFEEQTPAHLMAAIDLFENSTFDSKFIRQHAESFDDERFIQKIRNFVFEKFKERKRLSNASLIVN